MRYILALDQGTSSSRAVVVDRVGRIRAVAQRELTPVYPQPGWVEQDPNEIWASQAAVVSEVLPGRPAVGRRHRRHGNQ